MARFICVLSGKGGVGKTTSAVNLGLAMQKLGPEVIVVDGNLSSPNLSVHLGNTYFPVTIHDVMQDRNPVHEAIYEHRSGLKIIPAEVTVDAMRIINFEKLNKHIQDLNLYADYVIIDGSPGLGRETTNLINLADEILIVTNPDETSVLDAKRLLEFAKKFGKTITGLIVTKYRNRSHNMKLDAIEKFLNMPVLAVIPHDERFDIAIHKKAPYVNLYPYRQAAKKYFELAQRITGKVPV